MTGYQRYDPSPPLSVSLALEGESILVGRLAWSDRQQTAYFEYDASFIERSLHVSPFKRPLEPGAFPPSREAPFGGLHGLFNDSLPDGWGRWLLDRLLQRHNYNPKDLTPVDRLSYVGVRGMGALRYSPQRSFKARDTGAEIDLDYLSAQAQNFQDEIGEADLDRLHELQGSSGGARPKVMIGFAPASGRIVADVGGLMPDGFENWIVKFRSKSNDHAEIGSEEYAYSLMAKAADIEMPETRLMRGQTGKYFAVRRFDRNESGSLHVQTASGLLEVAHDVPQIDYEALLKLTRVLTRQDKFVQQMYRRMVFNVLARNRDDHAKNHAFQMRRTGEWGVTPAYDLTYSAGPGGQHSLAIAGEGREPGHKHVLAEAARASISKGDAEAIYQEVLASIENWPEHAAKADLSDRRIGELDYVLNRRGPAPSHDVKAGTPTPSP